MYLPQNEIYIKSYDHLIEVWNTGHWYLNSIDDQVTISNFRPDIKIGYPFWFRCSKEWFLSLKETTVVTALIFHVSRCGSTLCKNLLDTPESQICLNEPNLFNQAIMNNHDISQYMNRINSKRLNVIIKTSSWNISYFDYLKKQYPNAKTIFIYRDLFEVISSFATKPNGWIDNKKILEIIGINENDKLIRFAKCLDVFMSRTNYDLILEYDTIIHETMYGKLYNLLGYSINKKRMIEVSKINSKGHDKYLNDTENKKQVWNSIKQSIPKEIVKKLMERQNVILYLR